jgi:Gpi18-like mannosyltransferase
MFVSSRLLIVLIAWLSLHVVQKGPFFTPSTHVLEWFAKWDTGWYLSIVTHGYGFVPDQQSSVAFFPLYPTLVWLVSQITRDVLVSGYLIANAALYGALVILWKWVQLEYNNPQLADRACWLLLIGPTSFFFSLIYTESTFLFFSLACVYAARRRSWLWAGVAGYCAALCRNVGLLLVVPLLWEYFQLKLRPISFERRVDAKVLCCLLPIAGLGTYMLYLWLHFGDPLAFSHTQSAWGRTLTKFWAPFHPDRIRAMEPFYRYWFLGAVLLGAGMVAIAPFFRIRALHLAIIAGPFLLYLSTNNLESIPRYLSVLFPFYVIAAKVCETREWLERAVMVVSGGLLVLSTILFVNGYWFT